MKNKQKYTYLREIQLKFKKKRIKSNIPINKPLTDSQLVYNLFQDLQNETKEKLITISVNAKLKIICFEVVAIGFVNLLMTRPIEAIRGSIPWSPHGIIIVHNHPSGDPKPSPDDKRFTKKLCKSCQELGVHFLDHIIIGDRKYFSFADKKLL